MEGAVGCGEKERERREWKRMREWGETKEQRNEIVGLMVRRREGGRGLQLVAWGKTQQGATVVAGFSGDNRERG